MYVMYVYVTYLNPGKSNDTHGL